MSDIQTIFGLLSRQILKPQYVDVKLLHDETDYWRIRTKLVLADVKLVKRKLASCRCLIHRRQLNTELAGHRVVLMSFFGTYRQTRRVATEMDALYRAQLEQRAERLLSGRA